MLRITVEQPCPEQPVLALEGLITSETINLLDREIASRLKHSERLILDLQGVQFIDRLSLTILARWQRQGLVLRGGSLFVQTLLQSTDLSDLANDC